MGSFQSVPSPHVDISELHISHDLQLVNAAQALHSVSELEQVSPIHCHFELMGLTQDEDLQGWHRSLHNIQKCSCVCQGKLECTYFKVFPSWERKEGQLSFLKTPELTQVRVPYKHCRLNAWVQMQSNVSSLTVPQIDSKAAVTYQKSICVVKHQPCTFLVLNLTCEGRCKLAL